MFNDQTDSNILGSLDFETQKARDDDEANLPHISPSLVDTDEKMKLLSAFRSSSALEVQSGTLETSPSPKSSKEETKERSNVGNKSTQTSLLATPPTTPPSNNCSFQIEPSQNELQFKPDDSSYLTPDESSQDSISTNSTSSSAATESQSEIGRKRAKRSASNHHSDEKPKRAKRAASNHHSDEKPKRQKGSTPSVNDCDHLAGFSYAMIEKHKSEANPYIYWKDEGNWIFAIESEYKEDFAKLWSEYKLKTNELKKKSKIAFMQKTSSRRRKVVAKKSQSAKVTKKGKKMMETYNYKSLKRAFIWLEKNQDFEKVTHKDGVGKKLVYKFGKRFREDEQRKQKAIEDLSNY